MLNFYRYQNCFSILPILVEVLLTTHWTGTDAWRYWRGMVWYLGTKKNSGITGAGFIWWLVREGTMGRRLKVSGGWHRDTHSPPTFLMWRWIQWYSTGYHWRQGGREGKTGGEGRCDIESIFSMRFMAWYHQRTRSGCRSRLTSWPGCLAEWDFRQTSRRRLGWSAAPSEQQGTNRRQRTNDGWQGRY